MVRSVIAVAGLFLIFCIPFSPVDTSEIDPNLINDLNSGVTPLCKAPEMCKSKIEIVYLSGKVFNFAPNIIPAETPVPDVLVYLAEFPLSKVLNYRSDENGYWTIPVMKFKKIPLDLSIIFEKDGFVTTKSNVFHIDHDDIDSIAMQYPSTDYFNAAIEQIETQVSGAIGVPYTISSLAVVTAGKSWASMFFDQFPHGDPGATVSIDPAISFPSLGPIYFNSDVIPDPTLQQTSDDGGALFTNIPTGTYTLNAAKESYVYSPVTFIIEENVGLYIASPPHSLQGNNDSGPGEW